VISRTGRAAIACTLALSAPALPASAAGGRSPIRSGSALDEREIVERGLAIVRLDPKSGALPGECDDLAASDITVSIDRRPARVSSVERVPRPVRHWLLVDISESAEGRREEAKRSAAQYVREVMTPGRDVASVLSVDEDPVLVAGPSGDPGELARRIDGMPPGGWSALRDSLDQVLRQIEGDRHEHLILFWTDGEDQTSLVKPAELVATLARAPNATVFPIALLPSGAKFPPPPLTGATFTELARRSGGEVFISSDPRWLDRVRGWIGRRFTIAFAPPTEPEDGATRRRGLAITLRQKRCQVTLLPDPFARPDAVAGAAPPAPATWLKLHAGTRVQDDEPCETEPGSAWNWPLRSTPGLLSGCMLDLTRSPGPYVRGSATRSFAVQDGRFASREIQVLAPELARLPSQAAEAVEAIPVPNAGAETTLSPYFAEGNALLAQRAQIATTLFANRADYRDFALARLQREAADELRTIERDFARAIPALAADRLTEVARDSRAGRRVLEAARTPTDADLVRVLAAWVRDVPVGELLADLEKRLMDRRLRDGAGGGLPAQWVSIRDRLGMPSRRRIVTPLVLVHDPAQDVVGFVRVVLPRPERFFLPEPGTSRGEDPVDARLPTRPFALELLEQLAAKPEVSRALAARGYRTDSIVYEPRDPFVTNDPMKPYASVHAVVTLVAPPSDAAAEGRVIIDAELASGDDGAFVIAHSSTRVTGDPALAAALH